MAKHPTHIAFPDHCSKNSPASLEFPSLFRAATWDSYEATFLEGLRQFKAEGLGTGVFGDIDVDSNREWVQRVCRTTGIVPFHPLWKEPRKELLAQFIRLGFKATVVVVNDRKLDPGFLGRVIDQETVEAMESAGIDASGELGEYHTVVTGGPMFASEIILKANGRRVHEGYSFLETNWY